MKKFLRCLAPLLLLCGLSFGQTDIKITQTGPYIDLIRNLPWTGGGVGQFNNAYIFTPLNPDESVCVYVQNNNPTSAHSFGLNVFETGDQSNTSYYTAAVPGSGWVLIGSVTTPTFTVSAGQQMTFLFRASGAAKIVILTSGATTQAGSPDTAIVTVVQTTQSCGQAIYQPFTCNLTANGIALTGTTVTLVQLAGVLTQYGVHVCSYAISGAAGTAAVNLDFFPGDTATTCNFAGAYWTIKAAVGIPNYALSSSNGQLFGASNYFANIGQGKAMCFRDTGTVTGTQVAITYAIW